MVTDKKRKQSFYQKYGKRIFDIALSLAAMILAAPLMLVTAWMVRIRLGSPVIFRQPRPGKDEKIFMLYKFRSMTDATDAYGRLLADEMRLTGFGKKLRATSLDELPELFNILKGDMSFVGPRPQLVRDMVFMTPVQRKRHMVRQGLTGLAQVNGRNDISWDEKLELDLKYITNISLRSDCAILCKTVKRVWNREGIHTEGMATAEDYGDYLLGTGRITAEEYGRRMRLAERLVKHGAKNETGR